MRKLRKTTTVNTTGHKGNRDHPLMSTWRNMISRCYSKKHHDYYMYGGRGITVCERWLDFNNFAADVGTKPTPKHQLDRISSDNGYSPDNCRWVTPSENTVNSRPRNGRKYKGVYRAKGNRKCFAMITLGGKPHYLGFFETEKAAALSYDAAMYRFYGDKARLNIFDWEKTEETES